MKIKIIILTALFISTFSLNAQITSTINVSSSDKYFHVFWDTLELETVPTQEGYKIENQNFPKGKIKLEFRKKHYETIKKTLKISKGKELNVELPAFKMDSKFEFDTVFVKGGTYTMGDLAMGKDKEHEVTVNDFSITKYEITFEDFIPFLNAIHVEEDGYKNDTLYLDIDQAPIKVDDDGKFYFQPKEGFSNANMPMTYISYYAASQYAHWVGGRLPTEAEWEYAAKGGKKAISTKYAGGNDLDKVGWNTYNSDNAMHSVGLLKPNELGIYDMSGNVAEWCSDWMDLEYYSHSPKDNPQGPKEGKAKIYRGGAFYGSEWECSVYGRSSQSITEAYSSIGIRLVFDVK